MILSIIVPVYNVEQYIRECLESILASKLDCEVIMIEDGSADNSEGICKIYVEKYDNFHLYRNDGKGLSDARNMGLRKAKGDYIWFVDSDDLICGNITEEMIPVLNRYQLDVIVFDAEAFNETAKNWNLNYYDRKCIINDLGIMSGKDFFKKFYLLDAYRDSSCLNIYKKEFLDNKNIRFPSDVIYEDCSFTFEVYMAAEAMIYVPRSFYQRRYRNQSITTSGIDEKRINSFYHVLQQNIKLMKNESTDEKLCYVFRHYLFNYFSVQLSRIEQSDLLDKENFFMTAFGTFFREFNHFTKKGMDLSGINMILTYMNKIEKMDGSKLLENKIYQFENGVYSWKKLKRKVVSLHRLLVAEVLKSLPFDRPICVGVYGTGEHTKKLLKSYREYVGEIRADLVFLDSNVQSHTTTYEGNEVYNIRDVHDKNLEEVIISSCRYQDAMYHTISKMNMDSNIIKLYTKVEDTFDFFI